MHTHIMPKSMPDWTSKHGDQRFIRLEHREPGFADMYQGDRFFRRVPETCWDPVVRIEEYKTHHTQVQVVCTIPVLFAYWAKPEVGLEVAQFLNNDLAETIAPHPKNYLGLGTLPMQAPDLAVKELERCQKELGFKGVQIGSNINNTNLDDPALFPIFEAASELGMAIMVHPWEMMGKAHMEKYWLPWLVGMPGETSRAVCSMIFGGIFEKLPNLRVCFSHAGGSFLPTIGRVEHGFNCRPDLVAIDNAVNPREYIGKFWVDSITHDPLIMEYILKLQGSKRICLGSDYPFPLGDLEIGHFLTEMNLPESTIEDIFCNATLEWLNLDKSALL